MKRLFAGIVLSACALMASGCARITSQVVEKPRVDQELSGNGGYLAGSGPSTPPRKSTRKVIQTDIELPTASELNPWKVRKNQPAPSVPAPQVTEEEMQPAVVTPSRTTTVRAGDTLEKIAAREYGSARKWRLIYEANRDRLPTPNRIYPGQKLVLPEAQSESASHRSSGDLK